MRLGLLIYGDLATKTGGYLYDRMLVEGLLEKGHDVRVISISRFQSMDAAHLERLLLDLDIDILLEDELCHPYLNLMNSSIKDLVSYKIVALVHGLSRSLIRNEEHRRFVDLTEKSFLKSVDAFIYNSESTRIEVEALLGHSSRGVVAYPGKDHFLPQPALDKDFKGPYLNLIHVANISDHKGLDSLIEGLAHLPGFSLTVVGDIIDWSFFHYIERLIQEERIENRVEFRGPQAREKVDRCLKSSHIFALPSFYESFGIAYIEALGHGLPVIATTSGGIKEIITDGKEGFLVSPDDPESIALRLKHMQDNRGLLKRMSEFALVRYRSLPTWGQTVDRIREFLSGLEN